MIFQMLVIFGTLLYIFVPDVIGANCNKAARERNEEWPGNYVKPFPYQTTAPININSKNVQNLNISVFIIDASVGQFFEVINTGFSLIVQIPKGASSDVFISGGFLEPGTRFVLVYFEFYWAKNTKEHASSTIDGEGTPLSVTFIFIDEEYKTIDEAVKHGGGVLTFQIDVQVTNGQTNLLYTTLGFQNAISRVKKAKSSEKESLLSFLWLLQFPVGEVTYYTYPGSINYKGKVYSPTIAVTITPLNQPRISTEQFKVFLDLETTRGVKYSHVQKPAQNSCTQVKRGLLQLFVPSV